MGVVYPVSPWPGPSSDSVARPRARNTFSHSQNSSFVESRPGSSIARRGSSTPGGRRRLAYIVVPSNGISTRSAAGSSRRCTSRSAATALSAASRYLSMSTIQTNLAKWYDSAARFHASPAVRVRPDASASRASSACISPFATHAGSHSGHVSTPAVTRWKSLKSTPCDTNRGAQLSIAACTRSSGTSHHLLDRSAEIAQHDRGRVAPRPGGDGRTGMRRRAGLVQPRDREPVLGPARRGTEAAALRRAHLAAVARPAPVVLVQRLEVDRALDERREDRLVGQVRRVAAQLLQVRARDVVLDVLPPLRPADRERVRMEADDLERVAPVGRARSVGHCRADDEQRRILEGERPAADVPSHPEEALDRLGRPRGHRL